MLITPVDVVGAVAIFVDLDIAATESAGATLTTCSRATDRNRATSIGQTTAITTRGISTDRNRGTAIATRRAAVDGTGLSAISTSCIAIPGGCIPTSAAITTSGSTVCGIRDTTIAAVASSRIAVVRSGITTSATIAGCGDCAGSIAATPAIARGCVAGKGNRMTAIATVAAISATAEGDTTLTAMTTSGITTTDDSLTAKRGTTIATDSSENQIGIRGGNTTGRDRSATAITQIEHQIGYIAGLRQYLGIECTTAIATLTTIGVATDRAITARGRTTSSTITPEGEIGGRLGQLNGTGISKCHSSDGNCATAMTTLTTVGDSAIANMTVFGLAIDDLTGCRDSVVLFTFETCAVFRAARGADALNWSGAYTGNWSRPSVTDDGSRSGTTGAMPTISRTGDTSVPPDTSSSGSGTGSNSTQHTSRFERNSTGATIATDSIATRTAITGRAEITTLDRGNRAL